MIKLLFFYNQNFGKTISEGACGEFANALTELAAAFTLLNTVVDKLSGLNLKDLDLKKQAIALAQKLKIDAIAASIQETIEKICKFVGSHEDPDYIFNDKNKYSTSLSIMVRLNV